MKKKKSTATTYDNFNKQIGIELKLDKLFNREISRTSTNRTALQNLCNYKIIQYRKIWKLILGAALSPKVCLYLSYNNKHLQGPVQFFFIWSTGLWSLILNTSICSSVSLWLKTTETSTTFVQGATSWCIA